MRPALAEQEALKGTGALINIKDDRNILISQVVAPQAHPPEKITDISKLPVENQMAHGTCVGQAEGKTIEFLDLSETQLLTRASKRALYKACKLIDGYDGQGTYPSTAAKILVEYGVPKSELVPDDNTLPYEAYLDIDVKKDEIKQDASGRRVKAYTFALTLDQLKTMIDTVGVANITVQVGDWNKSQVKPMLPNGQSQGHHRIMVYGYKDQLNFSVNALTGAPDTKIFFRNSWGTGWGDQGNGWFWWSEYERYVFDMMTYLDMPNQIIEYVKTLPYVFTRNLKLGMSGDDVKHLQQRLAKTPCDDGSPCYRYTENGSLYFGTYFGKNTELAVQRYQKTKGIVSSGTPATTGYGVLGPKTRTSLNGWEVPPGKLEEWADATQAFEGWYPGSRSYRNNNPGNLRYIGQKLAIGEDRANVEPHNAGYCIFASYADGRKTLLDQLRFPALGKSTLYNQKARDIGLANAGELTLKQYYRIYAPTSDNNYPDKYSLYVATKIGVSVDTRIKTLVV